MTFRFRFASISELRKRERDEAGAAVGQALEAIAKIDAQREELENERQRLRGAATRELAGQISVDRLLTHGRYEMQLAAQVESLRQTRDQLLAALAERRQRLVDAEAEVKRFERLEGHDRDAYEREQRRREQRDNDEAAGRIHAAAKRGRVPALSPAVPASPTSGHDPNSRQPSTRFTSPTETDRS